MRTPVKLQLGSEPAVRGQGARKRARKPAPTVLLFGAGYTALTLAPHLQARGYRICAAVRNGKKNRMLRARGIEPILFNGAPTDELKAALKRAQIILSSAPPLQGGGDPILARFAAPLSRLAPHVKWAGYLSATSVYGDRQGRWAFEDELLRPTTMRGHARVEAELAWLETGLPIHIFRLAGIYGPSLNNASKSAGFKSGKAGVTRNPMERLRSGKARAVIKPGHVVNRIHAADIAAALLASIAAPNPMRVYNIADGNPAPPQDVLAFGARLLDMPLPPIAALSDPSVSDMARSFYKETKRIDISRARRELGFTPRYEDYRAGLLSLYAQADKKGRSRVYLAGHIDVPEAQIEAVKAALPKHIALTREEPGCLRFSVLQDSEIPARFHVFETFKSPAAFAAHQARAKVSAWAQASKDCRRDYAVFGLDKMTRE